MSKDKIDFIKELEAYKKSIISEVVENFNKLSEKKEYTRSFNSEIFTKHPWLVNEDISSHSVEPKLIYLAIKHQDVLLFRDLLEQGAEVTKLENKQIIESRIDTSTERTLYNNYQDVQDEYFQKNPDLSESGLNNVFPTLQSSPWIFAGIMKTLLNQSSAISEIQRLTRLDNLLNAPQDPDGNTKLHIALSEKNVHEAILLIRAGADFRKPNAQGITPLKIAQTTSLFGENNVEELFADEYVGAYQEHIKTSFNNRCDRHFNQIVYTIKIVEEAAAKELTDLLDRHPWLINASSSRKPPSDDPYTKFLMSQKKPNVWMDSIRDPHTFLMSLVAKSIPQINPCIELIDGFLKRGADVNTTDSDGHTALYYAKKALASAKNEERMKDIIKLLEERANLPSEAQAGIILKNINSKDEDGNNKLHIALSEGKIQEAILLLRMGADFSARNNQGYTPLMIAEDNNLLKVSGVLAALFDGANRFAKNNPSSTINNPNRIGGLPPHSEEKSR